MSVPRVWGSLHCMANLRQNESDFLPMINTQLFWDISWFLWRMKALNKMNE